ncbi:exonuclease domain-containing protein [Paenibacillus assamensis]|uniref:exonuclease domain-containing protein n=1 Tax=Paenibacillus assamensis TaxID=311244 RepID=UPI0003FB57D3|nr:exonuclease domain-containing protein [Paenibacillus assamensis]
MAEGDGNIRRSWWKRLERLQPKNTGVEPRHAPSGNSVSEFWMTGLSASNLKTEGAKKAYERARQKERLKLESSGSVQRLHVLDIPLKELPVVVIDLEMTGFEPHADEIVSFGAWRLQGKQWEEGEHASFYQLVNPGMRIPTATERLLQITSEEAAQEMPVSEGLTKFMDYMEERIVIAHASAHDKAFLRTALWRYFKSPWRHRMLDTMMIARWLYPQLRNNDLDMLLQHVGIAIERRHHALWDARATAELWLHFMDQAEKRRVTTLREMYMYLSQY